MRIGFIGLGAMGLPMTRHILVTALMAKDVDLVLREAARAGVAAKSADLVRPVLAAAVAAGYGREDFSALGKIVRDRSGLA